MKLISVGVILAIFLAGYAGARPQDGGDDKSEPMPVSLIYTNLVNLLTFSINPFK